LDLARRSDISASGTFIRQGDPSLVGGFVLKGYLRSYYSTTDGEQHVRNFSGPGGFIGPIVALLTNQVSDVTVEALTDVVILSVPFKEFEKLYDLHPIWDRLGRRLVERYYLVRERHAVELLTMDAAMRLDSFLQGNAQVAKHLPQKHLASYLGIRPETLNRLLKARK